MPAPAADPLLPTPCCSPSPFPVLPGPPPAASPLLLNLPSCLSHCSLPAAHPVLPSFPVPPYRDPDKQKEVGELLGPVSDEKFAQLVSLGKRITDWVGEEEGAVGEGNTLDDEIGVAVEFEDDDDDGGDEEVGVQGPG